MYPLFLAVVMLSFLVSCQVSPLVRQAKRELFLFADEIKQSDHLLLLDYGGEFSWERKYLYLAFIGNQGVGIDEARRIFVSAMEKILLKINQSQIYNHFDHFPFTMNRLKLAIIFASDPICKPADYVNGVSINFHDAKDVFDNIVVYLLYKEETKSTEIIHKEPYQEALEIVNREKSLENLYP